MLPFDRLLNLMTKPKAMIAYALLIMFSFLYFDKPITTYFNHITTERYLVFLEWLTQLGSNTLYCPLFIGLGIFFRFIRPNARRFSQVVFISMCMLVPSAMCGFLKVILGRARPYLWLQQDLYGFYGLQFHWPFWSFPSGHATTIMSLVFSLGIIFPQYFYTLVMMGLTIAFSRVMLLHHYLSDILTATYLCIVQIGILLCFLRRKSWLVSAWSPVVVSFTDEL